MRQRILYIMAVALGIILPVGAALALLITMH
jgi:hypothetical protein